MILMKTKNLDLVKQQLPLCCRYKLHKTVLSVWQKQKKITQNIAYVLFPISINPYHLIITIACQFLWFSTDTSGTFLRLRRSPTGLSASCISCLLAHYSDYDFRISGWSLVAERDDHDSTDLISGRTLDIEL